MSAQRPTHYTHTARFYVGRAEKQQQVVLVTSVGSVSALWDEDEAPYDESMTPREVSQILRERINSYWVMTDRADRLAKLDAIDAAANQIDREWMLDRADRLEGSAQKLLKQAARLRAEAEELEPVAEGRA